MVSDNISSVPGWVSVLSGMVTVDDVMAVDRWHATRSFVFNFLFHKTCAETRRERLDYTGQP